jgi:hypothetical protein
LPEILTLTEPHVVVVNEKKLFRLKIFLNRDANPKSRKKHENLESKKHIMGRTSRTE